MSKEVLEDVLLRFLFVVTYFFLYGLYLREDAVFAGRVIRIGFVVVPWELIGLPHGHHQCH